MASTPSVKTVRLSQGIHAGFPAPAAGEGQGPSAYNSRPDYEAGIIMEAERINAVANRIADLRGRGEQLRRYL